MYTNESRLKPQSLAVGLVVALLVSGCDKPNVKPSAGGSSQRSGGSTDNAEGGAINGGLQAEAVERQAGVTSNAKTAVKQPAIESVVEASKTLDLRNFELPKDAEIDRVTATQLVYLAKGDSAKTTAQKLVAQLGGLGWKPVKQADSLTDAFAQTSVSKDGYTLLINAMPSGKPNQINASLSNMSRLDTRSLPRLPKAKTLYENFAITNYLVADKPPAAAAALRKILVEAKWQEYAPAFSSRAEGDEQQILTFRQRGVNLSVFIVVAPAQAGQTSVQYGVSMAAAELPAPDNAEQLELDDKRPYCKFESPDKLPSLAEFYRQALPPLGYEEARPKDSEGKPVVEVEKPDRTAQTLSFHASDRGVVLVRLVAKQDRTQVTLEGISGLVILAMEKREAEREAKALADLNKPKPVEAPLPLARNLPLPDKIEKLVYDAKQSELRFQSKSNVPALVAALRKKLVADGWKEQEPFTIAKENIGVMSLEKEGATLSVRLINLGLDGATSATISGSGLDWGQ